MFHHLVTNQLATAAQNNVFEHVESKHWSNDSHAYSELRDISFNVSTVDSSQSLNNMVSMECSNHKIHATRYTEALRSVPINKLEPNMHVLIHWRQ